MANIRIDLDHTPFDGERIVFKAPCGASDVTGLKFYYGNTSAVFTLCDAHGNDVGNIDDVFADEAVVTVILDIDTVQNTNKAFIQNADTNSYIENTFTKKGVLKSNNVSNHLTDSYNGKLDDLKIYGMGSQQSYSGKNLLNTGTLNDIKARNTSGSWNNNVYTYNGVTYTVNGDGTYTVNGTASGGSKLEVLQNEFSAGLKLVGCPTGGSYTSYYLAYYAWKSGYTDAVGTFDYGDGAIVPSHEGRTIFSTRIVVASGTTLSNLVFKPMITTDTSATYNDFEPYVGGIPSPSPSYPQTIHSVVNPSMVACGKNLLQDVIERTDNSGNQSTAWIRYTNTIRVEKGATYTFTSNTTASVFAISLKLFNEAGQVGTLVDYYYKSTRLSTFTLPTDRDYNSIQLAFYDESLMDISSLINPMLEQGSTATAYEPYRSTTATLAKTLNAIPVSSGGNVTIDGQKYIADYVDVERKKLVRMCKTRVLNGTESWIFADGHRCWMYSPSDCKIYSGASAYGRWLSDKYSSVSANQTYEGVQGISISSRWDICDLEHTVTSAVAWKTWLASNNVTVLYELETPTEESLTDAEVADFLAMRSYYPQTNISVTSTDLDGASEFLYPCNMDSYPTENSVNAVMSGGVYEFVEDELASKPDKPASSTNGNFAGLDSNGNLTDSGKSASDFANASHTHDDRYYTESEVDTLLDGKSNTGHTHDDRYYTESEVDTLLSGKSDTNHNHNGTYAPANHDHDDRYYTESEVNSLLSGKSDTNHNHSGVYEPVISTLPVSKGGTGQQNLNPALSTSGVRGITISTTDLTAGTSPLTTGTIYIVYEA